MKPIEQFIIDLRDQKIILDSNVAKIYGVETRAINQAVQRNIEKFPEGYIFELDKEEWAALKSQIVISKGGKVKTPKAFTEKGLYMLATILKSKQATQSTIQIIETFAKVREFSRVAKSLATEKTNTEKQGLIKQSGKLIGDILNEEFADDTSSETTVELNLAMIKIKHTIIKTKKNVKK